MTPKEEEMIEAAYVEFLKKKTAELEAQLPEIIERKLHEAYQKFTPGI
ncbi:hypothetical protein OIT44_02740 [Weissella ceti]|uniref:Uncharacterized protein n=1 Tax=Weissella ceti TaxID=759620 RepID=A0ABT3E3K0_9LACO|nr:hypothetical protein [Weissella ceti]MCW0952988.1 hypothetical protein [Weissella ceti]QVK11534.1 hypothetical protein KHQ31_04750 [Weissella ceti]